MARRRAAEVLLAVASGFLLLSAAAHGFMGWPAVEESLEARIDREALDDVALGWIFGSVAMLAFGLLGFVGVGQALRGHGLDRWIPSVIGVAYVAFGVGALLYTHGNVYFLLFFCVPGALMLTAASLFSPTREL